MNEIQELKNNIEALQLKRASLNNDINAQISAKKLPVMISDLKTIDDEIAMLQDSIQRKSLAAHQSRNQQYPVPTDSK